MKTYLALIAAGGALAIGVPAALAATDAPSTPTTPVQSATPTPDQAAPDNDGDGRRGDCPEKDGSGGGSGSAAPSTAPDNSDTTL
jgi:hypothetical protein